MSQPEVTVSVIEATGNKIYVIGMVNRPGEFPLNRTVDVMQALTMAGGTSRFADLNDIKILRRNKEGKSISLEFRYKDVVSGRRLDQNILLQVGDVVVVP
jgi:polysaccharide export outer membrane protein